MRAHFYCLLQYIKYLFLSRHRKGYGIHSPFAFYLVREVIYKRQDYYFFADLRALRESLLASNKELVVDDFGAGSHRGGQVVKTVGQIVRHSAISPKYGRLLARLVVHFSPQYILELGTSIGFGTLYMAMAKRESEVVTIEGSNVICDEAKAVFKRMGIKNVNCVTGRFDDVLPDVLQKMARLDFAFVDGNHTKEATLAYFHLLLGKAHNDTVLVFDDIHWSKGMTEAWQEIINHPTVTVSMDLFRLGIVFFRRECQKQHYIVYR